MKTDREQLITNIIDEYIISHKGNAQCKCIEGARGHLIAKLASLFDEEMEKREIAEKLIDDIIVLFKLENKDYNLIEEAKIIIKRRIKEGKQVSAIWFKQPNLLSHLSQSQEEEKK